VVADSLRRGVVDSPNRRFRRPRLGLQRSKSGSQRLAHGEDGQADAMASSPIMNTDSAPEVSKSLGAGAAEGASQWSRMTRARSLSNTLGDLFRGKRQKTQPDDDDDDGDEEAGPSGS